VRVTYRYFRPMTVVFARGLGPYATSAPEAWRRMGEWLEQKQMRSRVKQYYGYFRDNPRLTAPELLRFDACVPATFGVVPDPEAGIGSQSLPGGAYAVHTHVGGYGETGELFSVLHREVVPKRGLSLDYDRPFLAIHLNDPRVTREMHRRTELCVPVLPVRMPLSSNDDDAVHIDNVIGLPLASRRVS
jgi:AraC family transcriptional regulator